MDIIRSLMSRCELLCEEFDVTEEKQGSEVYDPPVRLFCQLPHCGVDVCDYVFQDEKQEEVKQRIQELLDVDVDELEESEKSAGEVYFVFVIFLVHVRCVVCFLVTLLVHVPCVICFLVTF